MAKLKIQTGDGVVVPGQDTAEKEQAQQRETAEYSANLLYKQKPDRTEAGPDYTYSRIRIRKNDEINVYADEQDARYAIDPRLKIIIAVAIATAVVFVLACVLPTYVFTAARAETNLAIWLEELMEGVQNFIGVFFDPNTMFAVNVFGYLVTLLAGAAMALSGGIFQGSLKNALASPSTLGVTSGGTIGSVIYAVFLYPSSVTSQITNTTISYSELKEIYDAMTPWELFLNNFGSFFCSLIGCMAVVTIIMAIALSAGRGKVSNVALVIAGQVLTGLITLIMNFLRTWLYNHGDTEMATYLAQVQTSTFTGAYTWQNVLVFAIPLIACMALCFAMAPRMSLLAFNDEEARSMGISTTRMRNFMVAICTIMTALVISFCGPVGFVGFLVPHIARKLIGPDFRYLLPACALIGGLMVTAVQYITTLGIPFLVSGSAGVVTSVIGSISFLIVAIRGRRSSGGEWL